jgi:hypothetical protein
VITCWRNLVARRSTVFASKTPSGTVGSTTLTVDQIPLHGHPIRLSNASDDGSGNGGLIMREPGGVLIKLHVHRHAEQHPRRAAWRHRR